MQTARGGDNPERALRVVARGRRGRPRKDTVLPSQWNLERPCPFRLRTRSGLEIPVWVLLAVAAGQSWNLGDIAGCAEGAFRVEAEQQ